MMMSWIGKLGLVRGEVKVGASKWFGRGWASSAYKGKELADYSTRRGLVTLTFSSPPPAFKNLIGSPSQYRPLTRPYHHRVPKVEYQTSQFGEYQVLQPESEEEWGVPEVEVDSLIPLTIPRPPYAYCKDPGKWSKCISLKNKGQITKMRRAGRLASEVLSLGGSLCKPGTTTEQIDQVLRSAMIEAGSYPSTLNYMGFPASVCTSLNNVICHGIPDKRALRDGDIINIDVTVYLDGVHGDTSATYLVGEVDQLGRDLVHHTRTALELAIGVCGPNVPFSEIGYTISKYAEKLGYTVSEEFTGHGIGRHFHENPLILHHRNQERGTMRPGMTFTIEPMLCQGTATSLMWPDNWTMATEDGGRSAQFEHTLLITDNGVEILTTPSP